MDDLFRSLRGARIFDLAQPLHTGIPHHPSHPPFLFGLVKKHGDLIVSGPEGVVSSASDAIALGSHVGTHIDALCHFSLNGRLHGGIEASGVQSYGLGFERLSVDTIPPILRRGVLLDIAAVAGVESLPADFSIGPEHLRAAMQLAGVEIEPGDVVLLRTGWARFWEDPVRYITGCGGPQPAGPGPELPSAQFLSQAGIFAAGSDTVAFEKVPAKTMPVHVHFLVEKGIHIIEALNLEALAAARIYEFLFIAAPLKLQGATGSPLRPLAVAW